MPVASRAVNRSDLSGLIHRPEPGYLQTRQDGYEARNPRRAACFERDGHSMGGVKTLRHRSGETVTASVVIESEF
jgi:hypothetical protein